MKRVMIYKGELTDAPGRDERWVERVTFLGDDQWKLEVEGTDFHGNSNGESWPEQFSTEELVAWLDEQDSYLDDGEDEQKKSRLEALRVYAKKNGLDSTIRSIDKVTKKPPLPRLNPHLTLQTVKPLFLSNHKGKTLMISMVGCLVSFCSAIIIFSS